ncbi:MAG: hypothetical protein KAS66_16310, partial [Candidatus Omnitrophica bacterium]|nr:hypothetical protein [Candidatus Omnitrophota bacterium]
MVTSWEKSLYWFFINNGNQYWPFLFYTHFPNKYLKEMSVALSSSKMWKKRPMCSYAFDRE